MKIILNVTGLLHIIYYMVIVMYAGIQTTFAKFWLVMGGFWLGCSALPKHMLRMICWPLTALAAVFFCQEAAFVRMASKKPKMGADYVIVLGAQVKGTRPSRSLLRRIQAAADYLKENPETKVIASGGQGPREDITEAKCIRDALVDMGIASERILLESTSVSTWENIDFSVSMVGKNHRFVLATNGFHMYRAIKTAQMLGVENVTGFAAKEEPVLLLNYYVREFFAWMAYRGRRQ